MLTERLENVSRLTWERDSVFSLILALGFVGAAAFCLFFSSPVDFIFGQYWIRRYVLPLEYWACVGLYVGVVRALFLKEQPWRETLSKGLTLLFFFQMAVVLTRFLEQGAASDLTAAYFVYYSNTVASVFLVALCTYGFFVLLTHFYEKREPLLLPLGLLPFLIFFWVSLPYALPIVMLSIGVVLASRPVLVSWIKRDQPVRDMALIFSMGFVVRLVYAIRLGGMGLNTVLLNSDDAQIYHASSGKLLSGEVISRAYSIGYPGVLTALRWVTGDQITAVLIVQAFLLATVPVGVYLIGRSLFGRNTAILAGIFSALSQLLIYNSVNLTREGAGAFFIVWIAVLTLGLLKKKENESKPLFALAIGILAAPLLLTENVFLPIFLIFYSSLLFYRRWPLAQRVGVTLTLFSSLFLLYLFLGYVITGEVSLLSRTMHMAAVVSSHRNIYATALFEKGINPFAYPLESIPRILESPVENIGMILAKIWIDFQRYFFESNAGKFDPLLLVRNSDFAAQVHVFAYFAAALGVLMGLRLFRTDFWKGLMLYLFTFMYGGTYFIFFMGYTRHRATAQALFVLFCAYGVASLWHRVGSSHQTKLENI